MRLQVNVLCSMVLFILPLGASGAEVPPEAWPGKRPGVKVPAADWWELQARSRNGDGWAPLSLFGGSVLDVASSPLDPDIVLAGTAWLGNGFIEGGLYRSADGGASWSRVTPSTGIFRVASLAFTPTGIAYAGTNDGVWKSLDGGSSWARLSFGLGSTDFVREVVVDPGNADRIWVGLAEDPVVPIHLIRSEDGGATWSNVSPSIGSPMACHAVAVDPANTDRVFAAFGFFLGGGQLWRSLDGGTTWQNLTANLPISGVLQDVVLSGSRIFVAAGLRSSFFVQDGGVLRSEDDGLNWQRLDDGSWPSRVVNDLEIDPSAGGTVLAATAGGGLMRSTDSGNSWEIGAGDTAGQALGRARFTGTPGRVFLGDLSFGVFRSLDGGASFAPSSQGISELRITSIDANPLEPTELAAAVTASDAQLFGGVLTSDDGGAQWRVEPIPQGVGYTLVRFAPDGTLYAGSAESFENHDDLFLRDAAGAWTSMILGPGSDRRSSLLRDLRFSTSDPDLALASGREAAFLGSAAAIWLTVNAGVSWTAVHEGVFNGEIGDLEIVEDGTDTVMVAADATTGSGGALRSVNGGATWGSTAGLPATAIGSSLCASPADANLLHFADRGAGPGGLYRSVDGGQVWVETGVLSAPVLDVDCDPVDDQVLYALQGTTVLRSQDGGAGFAPFEEGLPAGAGPQAMTFAGPSRLLLSTLVGTFARQVAGPQEIFRDGFETGDLSAWSNAVP